LFSLALLLHNVIPGSNINIVEPLEINYPRLGHPLGPADITIIARILLYPTHPRKIFIFILANTDIYSLRTIAWNPLGTLIATGAADRTLRV